MKGVITIALRGRLNPTQRSSSIPKQKAFLVVAKHLEAIHRAVPMRPGFDCAAIGS